MSETVKIDFDLIPEHTRFCLMREFIHNYDAFWNDPKNVEEYRQWQAERKKKGEAK